MPNVTDDRLPSSSVQHSETSEQPLQKSVIACTHALWEETASQRTIHGWHRPTRLLVLNAFALRGDTRLQKRLTRMQACCCAPVFVLKSDGTVGVVPGFCRDRMCPHCQHHRGREVAARVIACVSAMNAPRFLTLTVKHTGEPLAVLIDRLYAHFRELRKSHAWKQHVRGGVGTLEVKVSDNDGEWHPHLHLLIDGVYWAHASIKAEWLRVTGDSSIVHIEACHDRTAAAKYVSTYIAKPADVQEWDADRICEYALALAGRRLVVTFGVTYAKPAATDDCETKPAKVSPLASAAAVIRAHRRGCPYGRAAHDLLCRVGKLAGQSVGHSAPRTGPAAAPLAGHEWHTLTVALRRCAGDETAWLPEFEPERRFNGQNNAGRRRGFETMRLFTGEDTPPPPRAYR